MTLPACQQILMEMVCNAWYATREAFNYRLLFRSQGAPLNESDHCGDPPLLLAAGNGVSPGFLEHCTSACFVCGLSGL